MRHLRVMNSDRYVKLSSCREKPPFIEDVDVELPAPFSAPTKTHHFAPSVRTDYCDHVLGHSGKLAQHQERFCDMLDACEECALYGKGLLIEAKDGKIGVRNAVSYGIGDH